MDKLRVRVYNVRFGDAILVSVPDRTPGGEVETRHILIDVGNVLSGEGGEDATFGPVIENVLEVLNGRPLDLYVMTHEHMDHVQGLLYASEKLGLTLNARHAWLTASAQPGYYEQPGHEEAKKKLDEARGIYEAIEHFLAASPEPVPAAVRALMLNNNPRSTADCVAFLRNLADHTWYVHREFDPEGKHPFHEARLEMWAPEENTAEYYGRFHPMALGVTPAEGPGSEPALNAPMPPSGVDAGAFYNLVEMRRHGYIDNLLAIDKAANNTSVVFCLEWRGWRLLFPGDAEIRSWKTMNREGVLKPVHFLKVGHHGSHNGTPPAELLDKILPGEPHDGRPRRAVVSTYLDTYNNVPDEETLAEVRQHCELFSVLGLPDGDFLDIEFEG